MNPFNISPISYHMYMTSIAHVEQEASNDGAALPSSLIIAPGRYKVMGQTYEMQAEGLYRFVNLAGLSNIQRIVYSSDPIAVISAAQWIISQSYAHETLTLAQKTEKAKTGKVLLACQSGAFWLQYILNMIGIPSRVFSGITAQPSNNYSDGHSTLEVYLNGKWTLFDTTLNARMWSNDQPVSGIEFIEKAASRDYTIDIMGGDTSYDISGTLYQGYSGYGFYEPLSNMDWMKEWYVRMFEIPLIYDAGYFWYYDTRKHASFQQWGFKYITQAEWMSRFYP